MACRSPPIRGGSNIPARPGCRRSACIITRHECIRRRSAGSCRLTPSSYEDGMNIYNYVRSDPINLIDPTGKKSKKPKITSHKNADGTYTWTASDGSSGTYDPSTNTVTFDIQVNGQKAGVEINTRNLDAIRDFYSSRELPSTESGGTSAGVQDGAAQEDSYGCAKAIGGGALATAIDPLSLVATGTASAVVNAGALGREPIKRTGPPM